jgi:alpha-tubulin suppressor-like RCC1 family protein
MGCSDLFALSNDSAPPHAAAIHLSSDALDLYAIGATATLHATVVDQVGMPIPDARIHWSSDDPTVATVAPFGEVTAVGAGRAQVQASFGMLRAEARVRVVPIPKGIARLEIRPTDPLLSRIGQTMELRVVALDAEGETLAEVPAHWSSSAPEVVEVDGAGVVTAVGEGNAQVVATLPDDSLFAEVTARVRLATTDSLRFHTLSAGADHTCALQGPGATHCFGNNDWGQLDGAEGAPSAFPTPAHPDVRFVHVAAGDGFTCGGTGTGELRCWGRALGAPPMSADLLYVVEHPVQSVAAGADHACALLEGGAVVCLGSNDRGQLGDGTFEDRDRPTPVPGLLGRALAAGSDFTCAIALDGIPHCWGANDRGQLMGVAQGDASPSPVANQEVGFFRVAAGGAHACGIDGAGLMRCWGDGSSGQLGVGEANPSLPPTPVPPPGDMDIYVAVAAGDRHTCATTWRGKVFCWGDGMAGQLGVRGFPGDGTDGVALLPLEVQRPLATVDFIQVTAGARHTCAITSDGAAYCWGDGADGRLGTGRTDSQPTPAQVEGAGPR